MITIGNSATDSARSRPVPNATRLESARMNTTTVSITAIRGTSRSFIRSSSLRTIRPVATMELNSTMPHRSWVSRNASATRIGMKVPNVASPITLRSTTTSRAPIGISTNTW
jgi:hypothetical protein